MRITLKIFFQLILLIGFSVNSYGQQIKYHTVAKNENIRQISLKYQLTPYDIIKANPNLSEPLKEGSKIVIPVEDTIGATVNSSASNSVANSNIMVVAQSDTTITGQEVQGPSNVIYHNVQKKETLYSLAKKYHTTIEDIYEKNPNLKNGLKFGMTLLIVKGGNNKLRANVSNIDTSKYKIHIVKPKETQWGLCHQYGISTKEFLELNPSASNGLIIGDTLLFSKGVSLSLVPEEDTAAGINYYEVKPKDTKYGISKKYSITIDELENLNPTIKNGLKVGTLLALPRKLPQVIYDTDQMTLNTFTDLPNDSLMTNSEKISRLDEMQVGPVVDISIMLPFYLKENETYLKYHKSNKVQKEAMLANELNNIEPEIYKRSAIAIDFYNGALLAIDSLKKLGISVRLKVYDTEKSLDKIKDIMDKNDFTKQDIVIGPLYTENAEYVADRLKFDNVLVLSPLSKKHNLEEKFNLLQAMPSDYTTKNVLLNKLIQTHTDSTHYYVFGGYGDDEDVNFSVQKMRNFSDSTRITHFISPNNLINRDSLIEALEPNLDNVLLVTSKSNVLLTDVLTTLNSVRDSLPNRIFLLNTPNNLEKIENSYLVNTRLIYPEDYFIDHNNSQTDTFVKSFRELNNYYPNTFAYRGFDVTFDILTTLSKNYPRHGNIVHNNHRQVQGKFDYVRQPFGGFYNKGVFVIQYSDYNLIDVAQQEFVVPKVKVEQQKAEEFEATQEEEFQIENIEF
jgi:LysM repeat protein